MCSLMWTCDQHAHQRLCCCCDVQRLSYLPTFPGATVRTIESMEQMNLYDINTLLILPTTKGRQCSFVELVADKACHTAPCLACLSCARCRRDQHLPVAACPAPFASF